MCAGTGSSICAAWSVRTQHGQRYAGMRIWRRTVQAFGSRVLVAYSEREDIGVVALAVVALLCVLNIDCRLPFLRSFFFARAPPPAAARSFG